MPKTSTLGLINKSSVFNTNTDRMSTLGLIPKISRTVFLLKSFVFSESSKLRSGFEKMNGYVRRITPNVAFGRVSTPESVIILSSLLSSTWVLIITPKVELCGNINIGINSPHLAGGI